MALKIIRTKLLFIHKYLARELKTSSLFFIAMQDLVDFEFHIRKREALDVDDADSTSIFWKRAKI